ncbi:MAG: hypothetical protein NTZ83_02910 [Candidatus Pacearchaeota archaeon]|nr:hypothetical protein [Candidatus Pacearchaeota archaeon]
MASHLLDIGFDIANQDNLKLFVNYVVEKGKKKSTKYGNYYLISPDGKIEIWAFIERGLADITPFYNGKSKLPIVIEEILEDKNEATRIRCWVNPNQGSDDGQLPFIFEIPNYWLIKESLNVKRRYFIQLTAFAEKAFFYENEQDFYKNSFMNKKVKKVTKKIPKETKLRYAPNCFISLGLFNLLHNKKEEAIAAFAGKIKEIHLITNKSTKNRFYWMILENSIGDLDVVCAEEELLNKPKVGGILDGTFYLAGKFYLQKRSLFDHILRRKSK